MFFYKKNLSAQAVARDAEPWKFVSEAPYGKTKSEFTSWCLLSSTNHRFLSLVEGENPNIEVSATNPAKYLHGILADYDGIVPDKPVEAVMKKFKGGYMPSWIALSRGDNAHVAWLFADRVSVCGNAHCRKLMEYVGRMVSARKMFGCLDPKSFDPAMYFEVGKKWMPVPEADIIPCNVVRSWDQDVERALRSNGTRRGIVVPIEKVAEEAEKRWPGRVRKWEVGASCLRFWDEISDNETGCQLCPDGVRVYVTGPNGGHDAPFKTWAQIFDQKFVDENQATQYDEVLADIHFDHHGKAWMKDAYGVYRPWTTQDILRKLNTMKFSSTKPAGETVSPASAMLQTLMERQSVNHEVYYLFHKEGVIRTANGEKLLNVSSVRAMEPARQPLWQGRNAPWNSKEVHDAFPFIHEIITSFWMDPKTCYDKPLDRQLEYLLAWWSAFYKGSLALEPTMGQALFLCGGVNRGKTFFSRVIMAEMMGGWAEASKYFLGEHPWNDEFVRNAIMVVDDSEASSKPNKQSSFQEKLKNFVANGSILMNGKYKSVSTVPLKGRFIATLNDDPKSLSVLPGLDGNIRDKISLLWIPPSPWSRPLERKQSHAENLRVVQTQLPQLCAWLNDHEIPDHLFDQRFGVCSVQHPRLDLSATVNGGHGLEVLEALEHSLRDMEEGFEGNATVLLSLLNLENKHLSRMTVKSLSQTMSALAKDGYEIDVTPTRGGSYVYKVRADVLANGRTRSKEWQDKKGDLK